MENIQRIKEAIENCKLQTNILKEETVHTNEFENKDDKISSELGIEIRSLDTKQLDMKCLFPIVIKITIDRKTESGEETYSMKCEFVSVFLVEDLNRIELDKIENDEELNKSISKTLLNKAYPFIKEHIENVLDSSNINLKLPMTI